MRLETAKKINNIPRILFFFLFFAVGLTFVILSLTVFRPEIPENYKPTEATIEKIQTERIDEDLINYHVYISYTYNGDSYSNVELDRYDSKMKKGDVVTIYVNEDDTSMFVSDNSDFIMFTLISAVLAAVGLTGAIVNIKELIDYRRKEEIYE